MAYRLALARPADIDELAALVNSAYRGDSSRIGWTTEADFLGGQRTDSTRLTDDVRCPERAILCAREVRDGPILGCVSLEFLPSDRGGGCHLGMLTVKPALQSKGLGRAILEEAERFARQRGAMHMTLGVIQLRDTLMEWYRRRGYAPTGETRPFPYGDEAFGLPLRDDLHFVMFEKSLADPG